MIKLSSRLSAVFDQVAAARNGIGPGRVLDVGSDHGLLAVSCLENEIANEAICTEIHQGPADHSKEALAEAGFEDVSNVFVTDGLDGIPLKKGDIVVIAGMGGLNIIDIVSRCMKNETPDILKDVRFVIQPQKSVNLVRKFFAENGFVFEDESVCTDRDFFYNVMRMRFTGTPYELGAYKECYGVLLPGKEAEGDPLVKSYFAHLDEVFEIRSRSDMVVRQALEERKQNEDK
ncbi:MAG: class I SAM-dependent methyltransferase [Saccharofermentans sp.]|nr:class I SAM-dependent methyltransferase [Saccharofermentans sp.]